MARTQNIQWHSPALVPGRQKTWTVTGARSITPRHLPTGNTRFGRHSAHITQNI